MDSGNKIYFLNLRAKIRQLSQKLNAMKNQPSKLFDSDNLEG